MWIVVIGAVISGAALAPLVLFPGVTPSPPDTLEPPSPVVPGITHSRETMDRLYEARGRLQQLTEDNLDEDKDGFVETRALEGPVNRATSAIEAAIGSALIGASASAAEPEPDTAANWGLVALVAGALAGLVTAAAGLLQTVMAFRKQRAELAITSTASAAPARTRPPEGVPTGLEAEPKTTVPTE
jgi:hypothetical protein